MKKTLLSLLALAALHAQATVLVVKEYGVNATYSTINAALAAAVNNDTIVVYDKPSGQPWLENLTIDKNLTFLHPTQGTRFKAPGEITVVPQAGMDLYFIGWDMNSKSITATATGATATSSNRAKITVSDCINVVNIDLNVDWIDARVFYNSITSYPVYLSGNIWYETDYGANRRLARVTTPTPHGLTNGALVAISGVTVNPDMNGTFPIQSVSSNQFYYNYYSTSTAQPNGAVCNVGNGLIGITLRHGLAVANNLSLGGITVRQESSNAAQNDSIIIVGNKSKWCYVDTKEAGLIANNYFQNYASGYYSNFQPGVGNALMIAGHNPAASAIFGVYNNTIINGFNKTYGGTSLSLGFNNSTLSNVQLVNNLCVSNHDNGTTNGVFANNSTGQPLISHNYINAVGAAAAVNICNVSFNNELNYTSTTSNAYGTIDTWGRAASGNTNLINKGNYLGQYYDIDLTRNDIGTYGGPYSIDNYLAGGVSKGKVLFIDIQHQLTNLNQILNAKAAAGSKF